MIKVTVPATTANLGPGFDTLGLALDIEATFTFAPAAQFEITGCPQRYCNENNLVRKAYCRLFQKLNEKPIPVRITIDSPIPTSRGLGSSSACILGGLCGANALLGEPVSALDLFIFRNERNAVRLVQRFVHRRFQQGAVCRFQPFQQKGQLA